MVKFFLTLSFLILSVFYAKADTTSFAYSGFQSHYGFIIPHSKSIEPISHTNPYGFEISLNKLYTSFNKWRVFNGYWISGFEAGYYNFQNPRVLGSVIVGSIFAEPILWHSEKFLFTIRGGAGLCYHSKIYDPVENPLNLFFSSRISFPLYVHLRFKYRISNKLFLIVSGCYNHISNGGIKLPNKGMNFPTAALGIERFNLNFPSLNHNYFVDKKAVNTKYYILFQSSLSVKVLNEEKVYPEKACYIYGFHSRIGKPISIFYALNAGIEMFFDGYIRESIRRNELNFDYKRFSMTFGQDFMFGKVIFTQYFGVYLYSPYKARNAVYQKYELAYRINQNLSAAVYIKAHMQVADLMGVAMNINILKKRKSE